MSFIQNNVLLIVGILLVLVFFEGLIIYVQHVQHKDPPKGKGRNKSGDCEEKLRLAHSEISRLKHALEEHLKKGDKPDIKKLKQTITNLETYNNNLENEKKRLEKRINDLTRENNELKKLLEDTPAPVVTEKSQTVISTPNNPNADFKEVPLDNITTNSSHALDQNVESAEETQEVNAPKEDMTIESPKEEKEEEPSKEESNVEPPKEITMYASFPRTADNRIYFSDLSENIVEDSYFQLIVSMASGKATFKPLDFMRIRNYDPAMAAMCTEGVKPSAASTVLGIEHGKAHIEGKDWIIDNLAKIKLA